MNALLRGYGRGLTTAFFLAVAFWGLALILLPQVTMLERAVTAPKRQLDSSLAMALAQDAETCITVLNRFNAPQADDEGGNGGLAVPSASGMAVPSASGMAVPSATGGGAGGARPFILQCDRAKTHQRLVRPEGTPPVYLDTAYGAPEIAVKEGDPVDVQIETAQEIAAIARKLADDLREIEASAFPYTLSNFNALTAPRLIPLSEDQKALEDAELSNRLLSLAGLRYEVDGAVYERLGLVTLARTLVFAVMATLLALILCYPIAYKVALATPPDRAVWLFLGLVIPYAIVELMRIYAWTTIIDNNGLLNSLLVGSGVLDEPVQLKRMPGTVFLVIVYTYVLFMVFPIFNVMSTLDRNQIEAAKDLGASTWRVHRRVIIPHAKPGIAVGCIATFMLAAGAFSVPRIISRGLQAEWFSQTIYNKFFEAENSNIGAAYSFAFTFVCFAIVALFMWMMRTRLKDFARVQ